MSFTCKICLSDIGELFAIIRHHENIINHLIKTGNVKLGQMNLSIAPDGMAVVAGIIRACEEMDVHTYKKFRRMLVRLSPMELWSE